MIGWFFRYFIVLTISTHIANCCNGVYLVTIYNRSFSRVKKINRQEFKFNSIALGFWNTFRIHSDAHSSNKLSYTYLMYTAKTRTVFVWKIRSGFYYLTTYTYILSRCFNKWFYDISAIKAIKIKLLFFLFFYLPNAHWTFLNVKPLHSIWCDASRSGKTWCTLMW